MYKVEFVCIANYCRSPVAEKIFNDISSAEMSASSSGVFPYEEQSMDPRSKEYLQKLEISDVFHIPSKFSEKKFIEADLIIFFELNIFLDLKKKYKDIHKRSRFYNFHNQEIIIKDPFTLKNKDEYFREMDKLRHITIDWADRLKGNL